jgi:hypothetical protein
MGQLRGQETHPATRHALAGILRDSGGGDFCGGEGSRDPGWVGRVVNDRLLDLSLLDLIRGVLTVEE